MVVGGGVGASGLITIYFRHCERSEAIQCGVGGPLDCRVASLLAMTNERRIGDIHYPSNLPRLSSPPSIDPAPDPTHTPFAG
jgi:hypothetical protein